MKNHTIYLTNPLDLDFWDISNFSLLQRTTCAFNLLLFESLHLELLPQEVFLEVEFLEVNHSECLSVCLSFTSFNFHRVFMQCLASCSDQEQKMNKISCWFLSSRSSRAAGKHIAKQLFHRVVQILFPNQFPKE